MNKTYKIAGLLIKITGFADVYFERNVKPYVCHTLKKPDITIRTYKSEDFIENKFEQVKKIGESQYSHEDEFYDSVIFYDEKLCRIVALIQFNKTYDDISVTVCDLEKLCSINQNKFLFNVIGIAMHYIVRMKNGMVIHSSAIYANGNGLAFSAQSGVGKSTHTSMWLNNISDAVMINDDTPIIRVENESEVYLYGSPWAGTSGLNTNIRVPLDAVVFLEQDKNNSMHKLSVSESFGLLFDAIRPPLTKEMHIKTLDTVDVVMRKSKMYLLKCNTDIDAMNTVMNKIKE